MSYLNKYKLIRECRSGFRHKYSYLTALIKFIDQWMNYTNCRDLVGTMFIDFRKAFNMVDHSHLIRKLSSYELSTLSLNWITS